MIELSVKVITNAGSNEVLIINPEKLVVKITESPTKGKANSALISLLATHFNIPKSRIVVLKGEKTKQKTIGLVISK